MGIGRKKPLDNLSLQVDRAKALAREPNINMGNGPVFYFGKVGLYGEREGTPHLLPFINCGYYRPQPMKKPTKVCLLYTSRCV